MIRRLALTVGCIALSAVAFSGKAQAELIQVDISGTVSPTCKVDTIIAGVMKLNPTDSSVLSTDPAGALGASRGKFTLSCTGDADLTVGIPVPQDPISGSVANYGAALVNTNNSNYAVLGGSPELSTVKAPNATVMEVDAFVNNAGTALAPGTYSYKVPVDIVAK
jgi:hypothetical protein